MDRVKQMLKWERSAVSNKSMIVLNIKLILMYL